MINTPRRALLTAGASAIGTAFAGCLTAGTDNWEGEETIPATSATMYKGPNCNCCDSYGEYLDASLTADLETVVTEDLTAVKTDHGISSDLRSCHTVELGEYLVEGHIPAETVSTLFEDEPEISGIALQGCRQDHREWVERKAKRGQYTKFTPGPTQQYIRNCE